MILLLRPDAPHDGPPHAKSGRFAGLRQGAAGGPVTTCEQVRNEPYQMLALILKNLTPRSTPEQPESRPRSSLPERRNRAKKILLFF
jgi:hypothetical protein